MTSSVAQSQKSKRADKVLNDAHAKLSVNTQAAESLATSRQSFSCASEPHYVLSQHLLKGKVNTHLPLAPLCWNIVNWSANRPTRRSRRYRAVDRFRFRLQCHFVGFIWMRRRCRGHQFLDHIGLVPASEEISLLCFICAFACVIEERERERERESAWKK